MFSRAPKSPFMVSMLPYMVIFAFLMFLNCFFVILGHPLWNMDQNLPKDQVYICQSLQISIYGEHAPLHGHFRFFDIFEPLFAILGNAARVVDQILPMDVGYTCQHPIQGKH
jgi:hypothetical protein